MTKRSVISVLLLTFLTAGIYQLYWLVATKHEMNRQGAEIPTAWLILIPFVSIYWMWKWSGGVAKVSNGEMSQGVAFLLLVLLNFIGMMIIQSELNRCIERGYADFPHARVA